MGHDAEYEQEVAQTQWDLAVETYRIPNPQFTYPSLGASSIVVDVGGYKGDWSAEIIQRYDPWVIIFEPVREFYDELRRRFRDNSKVQVHNYGLGSHSTQCNIVKNKNRSSFHIGDGSPELVTIRDVFGIKFPSTVDLMSINTEGDEYDLLPRLVSGGQVKNIRHLQVQFHTFLARATERRNEIRADLALTHEESYCYPFVWESWRHR